MFDDIVKGKSTSCMKCGHDKFEYVDGACVLLSRNRAKQLVQCLRCGSQWWIILNDKLEIIG